MMKLSSLIYLTAAFASYTALGVDIITNSGDLHIVNKELAPDGFERDTVVAGTSSDGGSMPGPIIRGKKGDKFSLNVIDELVDPDFVRTVSVHWHGLFQKHTNWADGPAFVTQCPIAPNNSFLYEFEVPDQAGTYWYHSHVGIQYCDGLRGAFIIDDPNDPQKHLYDVDDENTVISLTEWYHESALIRSRSPGPPVSDSVLINGIGRSLGGPAVPLAVINVEQGKRYRMRLVSMACDSNFKFSIDGHNMTVIEADGVNVEPVTVNSIQIFAAQRYSFVLNANQPVDNYRIRSIPNNGLTNSSGVDGGVNSAILRYKGAPDEEPTSNQGDVRGLTEAMLHPLENPGAPGSPSPGASDVYQLNMTLGFDMGTGLFSINDTPFNPPNVPVLLQILSGAQKAQDLLPPGSVYGLPLNKTIEINLFGNNAAGGPHPFHLHGHTFDVVKSFDDDHFNFDNPVRRDTTAVNGTNLTTIRFVTDNPGPWFLHCHIDPHLNLGLAVVLAEDVPDVAAANPVPAEWEKLCPIYDALPTELRPEQVFPPTSSS